jgi:hypothetical protein
MQSKNDEEFHQEEKLREEAKQEEQVKRAGEAPADIDAQYVRLCQEVSASIEHADNLLRNGVLGPPAFIEEIELPERLRAEREAPEPEPKPEPAPPWPSDKEYITVKEAGHLLATGRPPSLYGKPNDTDIRSDVIKSFTPYDIMKEILHWTRKGRVHLLHPTLMIIIRHPNDPDENWGVGREMFEHIKKAMDNGHEPAMLPDPAAIEATTPVAEAAPLTVEALTAPAEIQELRPIGAYEAPLVDAVDATVAVVDVGGAGASTETEEERLRRLKRERQARWRANRDIEQRGAEVAAKKNEATKRQQPPSKAIEVHKNPVGSDAEPKKLAKRPGRKPGDGAKNDDPHIASMRRLIAEGKASSPHAASKIVVERGDLEEKPAQNAHRRLSRKFTAKYESQLHDGESWGDLCRRIEDELEVNWR